MSILLSHKMFEQAFFERSILANEPQCVRKDNSVDLAWFDLFEYE